MSEITHGGGLVAARRLFPDAPEPWVDLSTGINPVPYPVRLGPETLTRLPEPEAVAALEAVAARAYGLASPAMAAAAPGTQSLIHLLPRLFPGRSAAVLGPAVYAEHAAAWALTGNARVVAGLEALGQADVAVVVRPNNPDGAVMDAAALLGLAARLAQRGGLLVVDEAFADFEGCSLAGALPHPGLALLRSFGKAYGLAGVRLGFLLGAPAIAARVREALGPWAVSGPAVQAGCAALADAHWREAAAGRTARDAARLDAWLTVRGAQVLGGTRLFRLASLPGAEDAFARLGRAGILVRRFEAQPGWLRFGLPLPAHWARLTDAWPA